MSGHPKSKKEIPCGAGLKSRSSMSDLPAELIKKEIPCGAGLKSGSSMSGAMSGSGDRRNHPAEEVEFHVRFPAAQQKEIPAMS